MRYGVARFVRTVSLATVLFMASAAFAQRAATLAVDATEAPRNMLHARETISVQPGPLTLFYPKWIPGEHGPTGPITDLVGLTIAAGGAPLPWHRDLVEMHAFHSRCPRARARLEVAFDFVLPPTADGFSSRRVQSTSQPVVLSWNQVVLYPASARPDDFMVTREPEAAGGLEFATALKAAVRDRARSQRSSRSRSRMLVDSPVAAGAHLRSIVPSRRRRPAVHAESPRRQ